MEELEGIIISEKPYSETSKIINVFTKKYGIIGMLAKGSRSLKSPLRSVTSKLTYGLFQISYKKDKLSILANVDIINPLKKIKTDIERISYVSFLVELATQIYKQREDEYIYNLLIDGILKINDGFDSMVITNILELKYLDFLGVMPILDRCAICGSTKGIETLSARKGGYICLNCIKNEKKVSEKTIKLIRMFYYVDISKIEKLDICDLCKIEINNFLDEYYDEYTGLYLKSKNFINNLNKIR